MVIDPKSPDFIAQVKQAAGGAVWAIIDCVGSSQTVQQGIDMLTKGGHLVQIGLFGGVRRSIGHGAANAMASRLASARRRGHSAARQLCRCASFRRRQHAIQGADVIQGQ